MEKADPAQKLYTRLRLWEFPDEYVIEPTDGSSGSSLSISRVDGSIKLIGWLIHAAVVCKDILFLLSFKFLYCLAAGVRHLKKCRFVSS